MAAQAHNVVENFYWRIEALTPPTIAGLKSSYFAVDPDRLDPAQSSGLTRGFSVTWGAGGEDHIMAGEPITDLLTSRGADHEFVVEMYYSTKLDHRALQSAMLQDRHEILKAMGDQAKLVGYDSSHTTTEIGLYDRKCTGSERDADKDGFVTLRMMFRCSIDETE